MMPFITRILLLSLFAITSTAVPTQDCVDKSSHTSPLVWRIENLQYSSRVKIGSFQLTDQAANSSTLIYCDAGLCWTAQEGDENPATNITGTISLTGGVAHIAFNQTWTCPDDERTSGGSPVLTTFTATATAKIPVQCDSSPTSPGTGRCTSVETSYLIYGSLLPSAPTTASKVEVVPRTIQAQSCQPNLPTPQKGDKIWQITQLKHWDVEIPCTPGVATPQPPPSNCPVNGIGLDFVLANNVLGKSTTCKGVLRYWYPFNVTELTPAPGPEMRCDLVVWSGGDSDSVGYLQTWATVRDANPTVDFSARERVLNVAVEQAWGCNNGGGGSGSSKDVVTARGSTSLPLSCTVQSGSIDFWSQSYPWHNTTCTGQSSAFQVAVSGTS